MSDHKANCKDEMVYTTAFGSTSGRNRGLIVMIFSAGSQVRHTGIKA
jgi:hypothetical protein